MNTVTWSIGSGMGRLVLGALVAAVMAPSAAADEAPSSSKQDRFLLRYKFKPSETVSWQVEQHAKIRTTVAGTTQTAETITSSVKTWKVTEVSADGRATFVHSVDHVDMRQLLSGRQEVRYNSDEQQDPPPGFQDVAKSVGVPLSVVTIDARGNIVKREDKQPRSAAAAQQITITLPEEPIALGGTWTFPYDIDVTTKDGSAKKIKARQKLTLESVQNGVAVISTETQLLTPVTDPVVEAQVVQSEMAGKIRFDIAAGRVISQQSDVDKQVIGSIGEGSSMHYVNRFSERLLSEAAASTAALPAKPVQGPEPPPAVFTPPPAPKPIKQ